MTPGTIIMTDDIYRRRGRVVEGIDTGYLSGRGYVYVDWDDGKPSSWMHPRNLVEASEA
jgi:hypothetical protein